MSDLEKIGLMYHLKLVRESNEIVALRMKEFNQELETKNSGLTEELQAKEGHLKALMLRLRPRRIKLMRMRERSLTLRCNSRKQSVVCKVVLLKLWNAERGRDSNQRY